MQERLRSVRGASERSRREGHGLKNQKNRREIETDKSLLQLLLHCHAPQTRLTEIKVKY